MTHEEQIAKLTEMLEIQQKLHETAIDMLKPAIEAEREACAEVCKKHADVYEKLEGNPTAKSAWAACIDNRDAIRARGQA